MIIIHLFDLMIILNPNMQKSCVGGGGGGGGGGVCFGSTNRVKFSRYSIDRVQLFYFDKPTECGFFFWVKICFQRVL